MLSSSCQSYGFILKDDKTMYNIANNVSNSITVLLQQKLAEEQISNSFQ